MLLTQTETRTIRTPAFWGYPPPPHDHQYHGVILDPKSKEDKVKVTNLKNSPKFQIFEFWHKHYTRHTFWSCLIRCANIKRIQWVLLKIQSGHDSVHRRTDGQGETNTPPFQLCWSGGYMYEKAWCQRTTVFWLTLAFKNDGSPCFIEHRHSTLVSKLWKNTFFLRKYRYLLEVTVMAKMSWS